MMEIKTSHEITFEDRPPELDGKKWVDYFKLIARLNAIDHYFRKCEFETAKTQFDKLMQDLSE